MASKNPYAYLREKCGLSQQKFCDKYKFAKQTLVGIEAGFYADLSQRMVYAIKDAASRLEVHMPVLLTEEYGTFDIQLAYAKWRLETRQEVELPAVGLRSTDELSPMHFYVKDTVGSVQGFAKMMKIPPATLLRYIRGGKRGMPWEVREAFNDAGLDTETLETEQQKWALQHG